MLYILISYITPPPQKNNKEAMPITRNIISQKKIHLALDNSLKSYHTWACTSGI